MKRLLIALFVGISSSVMAGTGIEYPSGVGKAYLVYADDPFNGGRSYKYLVVPDDVYVRCESVKLKGRDGYFDEFSFPADIKIRADGSSYEFKGSYSTVGISDSRYYTITRSANPSKFEELINAFKSGSTALVGGKWHTDWEHETVNLSGFTKAYQKLGCE